MVGAGIGILATEFGYFLADLIFKEKGLKVRETYVVFDRYRHPSFVGFSVGLTVIPGSYTPYAGMHTDFKVGPTVGAQGAWFASPYVGVGGRFAVTNLEMNVNGVPQNDEFECCSVTAGPYFSYPLSTRWRIGSKLLCGYEHYKPYTTSGYRIEGRGGFTVGTGFFVHLSGQSQSGRALYSRLRRRSAARFLFLRSDAQTDAGHDRKCDVLRS